MITKTNDIYFQKTHIKKQLTVHNLIKFNLLRAKLVKNEKNGAMGNAVTNKEE